MKSARTIVMGLAALAFAALVAWLSGSWADAGSVSADPASGGDPGRVVGNATYPLAEDPQEGRSAKAVRVLQENGGVGALQVHLSFEGGLSAAGIGVEIRNPWWTNRPECVQSGTTNDDGLVVFPGLAAGQKQVEVDRAILIAGAIVRVAEGRTTEVAFTLPVALKLEGSVVDHEGKSVADAAIWMGSPYAAGYDAREVCRADAQGQFRLISGLNPCIVWARANGHAPSTTELVHAQKGAERAVKLVLSGPGASLTGIVRGLDGEPLAGATVRVGEGRLDELTTTSLWGGGAAPCAQVQTDEAGQFQFDGVPEGEHEVSAKVPGLAPWSGSCQLRAGRTAELTIQMSRAASVSGVVRDTAGAVVARAEVRAGRPGSLGENKVLSGEHGEYELTCLAEGRVVVMGEHADHGQGEIEVDCVAGSSANADLVLSCGRQLVGQVVTAAGRPVAGAAVWVWPELQPGMKGEARFVDTDERGRFAVANLGEGPCVIKVHGTAITERVVRDVLPESGKVNVVVDELAAPTSIVHGSVQHARGLEGVRGALVVLMACGATVVADTAFVDDSTGEFLIRGVRAGWYRLAVESKEYPRWVSERRYVRDFDDWDLGQVKLGATGSLRLDVVREGSAVGGVSAVICDDDGEVMGAINPVAIGESGRVALFPGRYKVTLRGMGVAAQLREVVVEAGQELPLTVRADAGVRQRILLVNRGDPLGMLDEVRLTVANTGECVVEDTWGYERIATDYWLAPGSYVVRVDVGTRTQEASFEVGETAGRPVEVVLP